MSGVVSLLSDIINESKLLADGGVYDGIEA